MTWSPRRSFSPSDSHSDPMRPYYFLPTQFSAILYAVGIAKGVVNVVSLQKTSKD